MPTLEVQLIKAQTSLASLEEGRWMINGQFCWPPKRADQLHGKDAELRGLRERVGYLQQRIEIRDARAAQAAQREAAQLLVQLAVQWIDTYESPPA